MQHSKTDYSVSRGIMDDNGTAFLSNIYSNQGNRRNITTSSGNVELYNWRVGLFGFGGTAICCFGIICNIAIIIVLIRLRIKSSPHFLLVCLFVLDCIYLLSFLFLETLSALSSAQEIPLEYRRLMAPVYGHLYWLPLVCQTCTAYVVVVITLERFVLIVLPFEAHKFSKLASLRIAAISVFVCVLISGLYHIPDYLAFRHEKESQTNITRIVRTELGQGNFYTKIYSTWMNFTVNFLIPLTLLLIFNGLTLNSLYHSGLPGAIRARQAHQKPLTIMIITMIAVFFVCELLAAIAFIFTADLLEYHLTSIHINRLSALADTLMLLKSALNFVIYSFTRPNFKQAFFESCCCCCQLRHRIRNGNPGPQSSSATAVNTCQTGRGRPLSSLSSSSGGLRVSTTTSCESYRYDPRFRRSSSNASSGIDDYAKVVSGRFGSNGSGTNHNSHTRARIFLSTMAASDRCIEKSTSPIEMAALIEHREGVKEKMPRTDQKGAMDKHENALDSQFRHDLDIRVEGNTNAPGNRSGNSKIESQGLLPHQANTETRHDGHVGEDYDTSCNIENTQIDDSVFYK